MACTDTNPEPAGRISPGFYAVPVVLAVLAAAFYSQFWLSHDDSWYLIATRKFLEGQQLYVDIIEVNPPLNFYLTAPALFLADATGLGDTVAYVVQVCLLCGLSGLWLTRILRASTLATQEQSALLLAGMAVLLLLPIGELAQREHLLFVFALPYFLHEIVGAERIKLSSVEQALLGLVATLGLALKPYFLLLPAAIVLVGPVRHLLTRAFSPSNLGLAAGLLAYAAFTIIVHPGFFSDILTVAGQVYWAYGFSPADVLLRGEIFAVIIFAYLFFSGGRVEDPVSWRFAAAVTASLLSYLIQFKGWNYQLLPLLAFLLMGSIWLATARGIFQHRYLVAKAIVAVLVMITVGSQLVAGPYRPRTLDILSPYVERPGESIVVYSTNLSFAFPFVNAVQGEWASRYPAQWLTPGALIATRSGKCTEDREFCATYEDILSDVRLANTEDLLRYRPDLVIFDVREDKSYFHGEDFDYLAFQLEDPRFAAEWENYAPAGTANGLFDVWRREKDVTP